jgi:hypothetical protein
MSKQQAILETLLGAAELTGNRTFASRIRHDIEQMNRPPYADGYQRLASAADGCRRERRKVA